MGSNGSLRASGFGLGVRGLGCYRATGYGFSAGFGYRGFDVGFLGSGGLLVSEPLRGSLAKTGGSRALKGLGSRQRGSQGF